MRSPANSEPALSTAARQSGGWRRFGWCLITGMLSLPMAQAQMLDYTVRPGDNPWDFARQHLKPGLLQKLIELNGIKDPHHIPPGRIIHIDNQWLFRGSRPVSVVEVVGDAALVSSQEKTTALRAGEQISAHSRIRTQNQASVTLQFSDGSRILIGEASDVRLLKNSFVPLAEGRDIRLSVPDGKVENDVNKQQSGAGRFEIRTPSGIAAVRGTRFRLASRQRETRTEVLEGKVAVADQRGGIAALPAGYGMALQRGRQGTPRPLLKGPSIAEEALLVEQLPIDLELVAVPEAVAYRTLVSAPGRLTATLSDQRTETAVMRIRDIPDGDYQLRVRAIDSAGLEGEETWRRLTVNVRPSAPFLIAPTAEAALSASRPAFSWARHSAASSYHFQLSANPEFTPLLIDAPALLEPAFQPDQDLEEGKYYWRLATISATEGAGPYSRPESFLRTPAAPGNINVSEEQVLRWQKQAGARYQIRIGQDAAIDTPLIDRIVDDSEFSLNELEAGIYFVRIKTIGASGLSSQWSEAQSFTVESSFDWRYLLLSVPLLLLL